MKNSELIQLIRDKEEKIKAMAFDLAVEQQVLRQLREIADPQRPTKQVSLTSLLVEILKERGRPMRVANIVDRLKLNGLKGTEKTSLSVSAACLLRRAPDRFNRVAHGVYELKDGDNNDTEG